MAGSAHERTVGQNLNTWVQTIGIIAAAAWGAYAFIYKEIKIPKSAPVNISLNLQLKKIETGDFRRITREKVLVPIEMRVSVTNPSARTVFFFPNAFLASGLRITPISILNDTLFDSMVNSSFDSLKEFQLAKHSARGNLSAVAVGRLFSDAYLRPGETVTRTVLFDVPPDSFDRINVVVYMATMAKRGRLKLKWNLKGSTLEDVWYDVIEPGQRRKIAPFSLEGQKIFKDLDVQLTHSVAEISLRP